VTEILLKQAGVLGATTQTLLPDPLANQPQNPTQSGGVEAQVPPPPSSEAAAHDLDHKIRQVLETVRSTAEPEARKLLPELAALLAQTKEQAASALPEMSKAHSKSAVLEQTAVLSDQVLSRQTEAAFEWLKNGALLAELPMQFGTHSTQARIRFFQEADKDSKGHSGRSLNINIYLDLPDTGRLEAWARWEGQQIQATLYVRDAETRELFESQLQELSVNLREAGFSTAVLDVRIDAARLYKIQESVEQTLPHEGSLLSLRV
jgi:flagellar hook-length control protein FliK